jgi:hypothetical protein
MTTGFCRLNGTRGELRKAHIIPQSFLELTHSGEPPGRLIDTLDLSRTKKSPTGLYDEETVGPDAEDYFAKLDGYANQHLLDRSTWKIHRDRLSNAPKTYVIEHIDSSKIKLFCVSVIWRASVSNHLRLQLGAYEAQIAAALRADEVASIAGLTVNLFAVEDEPYPVIYPVQMRVGPQNWVEFLAGGLMIRVKLDKRKTSQECEFYDIRHQSKIILRTHRYQESERFRLVRDGVNKGEAKFGNPWRQNRTGNISTFSTDTVKI